MPITYRYHQDTRDGQIYPCVLMPDGKWWSATDSSHSSPGSTDVGHGLVYPDRASALAAVPPGAHMPTILEGSDLVASLGAMPGTQLKSTSWDGTDDYGFNFLPLLSYGFGAFMESDEHANPSYVYSIQVYTGDSHAYGGFGGYPISVRFIVDTFNEPSPFTLFGAGFQGFERGHSTKVTRQIEWVDSIGGTIRGVPMAPATYDEWEIEAEFWVNASQAQAIEAAVPPYGTPTEQAIRIPARGGDATFAGLKPHSTDGAADLYQFPEVRAFSSMGRKGVRQDLYGYRITFALRTFQGGFTVNPQSIAPTTTVPAWLQTKFGSHQSQDWSSQAPATFSASQGVDTGFRPVKHGRRRDVNFNLDHLSTAQVDSLVAMFRGVRHNSVVVQVDNGANGIQSVPVYLKGLSLQRGAGLWWDGALEMVLA